MSRATALPRHLEAPILVGRPAGARPVPPRTDEPPPSVVSAVPVRSVSAGLLASALLSPSGPVRQGAGHRHIADGILGGMDRHDWDRRYSATDLVWTAEPNRWLVAEAAGLPPGRALDLGCGEGRNAVWLARQGWQVTAVDFSPVALGKGRGLAAGSGGRAVDWVEADVRTYGPEPAAYDLVLLAYVHLPEPDRGAVHRAAARAVAPGGVLLVVGHDTTNLRDGVGGPQDPAVLFTPADVVDNLASVDGLEVERAERVLRPVPMPDGERQAVDALVRVHRRAAHPPE